MITVFALHIYLGTALQQPVTYWYDINRCRYFARRIMNQPPMPAETSTPREKITAICKLQKVKNGTEIYH